MSENNNIEHGGEEEKKVATYHDTVINGLVRMKGILNDLIEKPSNKPKELESITSKPSKKRKIEATAIEAIEIRNSPTKDSPHEVKADKLKNALTHKENYIGEFISNKSYHYIQNNDFLLGEGGFGKVYLGYCDGIKQLVAIKESRYNVSDISEEVSILEKLQPDVASGHVNVVHYLTCITTKNNIYIVMDFYEYNLDAFLEKQHCSGRSYEDLYHERIELVKQLFSGLIFLHKRRIVHRDLKPNNIMVDVKHPDSPAMIKIVDFGISQPCSKPDDKTMYAKCGGNPIWLYPDAELYDSGHIDFPNDVFVGIMISVYIISGGEHPFLYLPKEGASVLRKKYYRKEVLRADIKIQENLRNYFNDKIEMLYKYYELREEKKKDSPEYKNIKIDFEAEKILESFKVLVENGYQKEQIKDRYEMECKPRGRCIVINNMFEDSPLRYREGSAKDVLLIQRVFEWLHFEFKEHNDVKTREETLNILKTYAQEEDNCEAFICFILSHGVRDHVICNNGDKVNLQELIENFQRNSNEALNGKPKLFFIQACQNDQRQVAADSPHQTGLNCVELETDSPQPDKVTKNSNKNNVNDVYMCISCTPGTEAYLSHHNGSWFIQTLGKVFKESAQTQSLSKMIRNIKETTSNLRAPSRQKSMVKMTPNTVMDTLMKELYFNPDKPWKDE